MANGYRIRDMDDDGHGEHRLDGHCVVVEHRSECTTNVIPCTRGTNQYFSPLTYDTGRPRSLARDSRFPIASSFIAKTLRSVIVRSWKSTNRENEMIAKIRQDPSPIIRPVVVAFHSVERRLTNGGHLKKRRR